jgi:hypothetical protein
MEHWRQDNSLLQQAVGALCSALAGASGKRRPLLNNTLGRNNKKKENKNGLI